MTARIFTMTLSLMVVLAGGLWAVQNQQQDQEQPDVDIRADDVEVEEDAQQRQQLRDRQNLQETGLREEKHLIHRASALIGMEVQNPAGENLGDIHDLTITDKEGKVEYAAVSFGGFVGIGDKLFAVPWDAVQIKRVENDWVAIMDVSEQDLENAQGFDKDKWPDMADEQWRAQNDRAFRTTQREERETTTPRARR